MTMHRDERIAAAVESIFYDALEISKDDPGILTCNFDAFCRVMWPDETTRTEYFLTRDDYKRVLEIVFHKLH